LARKQLSLAEAQSDDDFKRYLVEDALENCVSAFDGFGREACRVRACSSRNVGKATNMSFQNLERAAKNLSAVFGIDMKKAVSDTDWNFANVAFMRRHVIAHNGGVIDRRYLDETGESDSFRGRRVTVSPADVEKLTQIILILGRWLVTKLGLP
jgi:hypothetical protein